MVNSTPSVPERTVPATYVHGYHESVMRSHEWRTAANSAEQLVPLLAPGQRLLDVGCGPGTITADLAALVAPGEVVAVDLSTEVLARARVAADARGLTNVRTQVSNVYALDFPDHHFDVVHAHQVLQHLADPVAALREMRRVTRPGGIVTVRDSDYAAMSWFPAVPELDDWMALYQRVARAGGGEPDAGRRLKSWALASGLTDLTCTAPVWCYSSAEEISWWGGLWQERVTASTFAVQAVSGGHAGHGELQRIAAGWRRWSEQPDAWFAVPHGAVLGRV